MDDYDLDDDENERNASHGAALSNSNDDVGQVSIEEQLPTAKVEEDESDPGLAEWLKIDEEKTVPTYVDDDSETEADSDNADVVENAEDSGNIMDDWFQVKTSDATSASGNQLEKVRIFTIPLHDALRFRYRMTTTQ